MGFLVFFFPLRNMAQEREGEMRCAKRVLAEPQEKTQHGSGEDIHCSLGKACG